MEHKRFTDNKQKKIGLLQFVYSIAASSLPFNGHFPGGFGLAGTTMTPFWILLALRVTEVLVITAAIRRAKLQSNCHHQQDNTQLFCRPDALPVAQPTVSKHWRYCCFVQYLNINQALAVLVYYSKPNSPPVRWHCWYDDRNGIHYPVEKNSAPTGPIKTFGVKALNWSTSGKDGREKTKVVVITVVLF